MPQAKNCQVGLMHTLALLKLKRSPILMRDFKVLQDANVEERSQVEKREQGNVDTPKSRTYSLAKKALGVATAALLFTGGTMAALSRTDASSSALDLKGNNDLMNRDAPPLPDKKWLGEFEHPSWHFNGQSDVQTATNEGTSQLTEKLQRTQGIRLKEKVKIARLSGEIRSRKVTPERKLSQSTKEIPLRQLEQDKGKEAEPIKLSKEEIDSLQFLLDTFMQDKLAMQSFKEVWQDKEGMESIKDLMQDEKVRECALSTLKNKECLEQAISSLKDPEVLQAVKKVLNNKEYMEEIKNLMQDKESIRRLQEEPGTFNPMKDPLVITCITAGVATVVIIVGCCCYIECNK
jgi:predicted CopG family antitoxin